MSAVASAASPRSRLAVLGVLLGLAALASIGGPGGRPAVAQRPEVVEEVELVAGCQIRAFMPHYWPGTPLFEIANDIEAGNPRFWFMHQGPVPLPSDLFDPASAERSVVDVLWEEAGYVCVNFGTIWHRPLSAPPPCIQEPCPLSPYPEPRCPCAEPPDTEPTAHPR